MAGGGKVAAHTVTVYDRDDRGGIVDERTFLPGDEVPAKWAKLIDNPLVWEGVGGPAGDDVELPGEPITEVPDDDARADAWRDFARSRGVDVGARDSKAAVRKKLVDAGVLEDTGDGESSSDGDAEDEA